MHSFKFYKFFIFFLFVIASVLSISTKNLAFAQSKILQIDSSAKTSESLVDQVFGSLYEQPYLEPSTEIFDASDKSFSLKEFRNKFVILYFWATWCNTCVQEMQSMTKMVEQLEFQDINDVVILPISIDFKTNQQISGFYQKNNLSKLSFFKDQKKKLMSDLKVTTLPTTFFINKDGYIIQGFEQSINWDNKYLVQKLLELKGPNINSYSEPVKGELKKEGDSATESAIIPVKPKSNTPTIIN